MQQQKYDAGFAGVDMKLEVDIVIVSVALVISRLSV
jgi:hypothetical protein